MYTVQVHLHHVPSCGRVTTDQGHASYAGATRHTNNTGELTALLRALEYELAVAGDDQTSLLPEIRYERRAVTRDRLFET